MKTNIFMLCISYKCYLVKIITNKFGVKKFPTNSILNYTTFNYFFKSLSIIFLCFNLILLKAQSPISAVTTVYQQGVNAQTNTSTGAPGSSYSSTMYKYNYGTMAGTTANNNELINFTANGLLYTFIPIQSQIIKLRRVNNPVVSGVRQLRWSEGTVSASNVVNDKVDYIEEMEKLFVGNNHFNTGTDNLFGNQGDGNGDNNNIERLDVIYPDGIVASDYSKVGFALFERGVTTDHDPVKVAVILSLDAQGNPSSYSNIISIDKTDYQNATNSDLIPATDFLIERMDTGIDTHLKIATTTKQPIGGVFFKYSDFGIVSNVKIYGYSVIPNDFSGTKSQIVDYKNATYFPLNTSSSTGDGGIDLVSFTGISQSSPVLNLPINGHVYDDATGLVNGLVNGTGTNVNNSLYVHLVNASNVIIATTAVNADGSFSFPPQIPGNYKVILNSSSTPSATPNLPNGWLNIGEDLEETVATGGTVDGVVSNITISNSEIYNVNFGIDLPPNSVNLSARLSKVANDSLITLNGLGGNPPALQGSDFEDQPTSGSLSGKAVQFSNLPTNSLLYYNNVLILPNQIISNLDPNLLKVKINTTNPADTVVVFKYAFVDAAGIVDPTPATYTLNLNFAKTILAIKFLNLTGKINQNIAVLKWDFTLDKNTNVEKFEVEQSSNAINWQVVKSINTLNDNVGIKNYSSSTNILSGVNYFRIAGYENNGTTTYSNIINLFSNAENSSLVVYPTVATSSINVNIPVQYKSGIISIFNLLGVKILSTTVQNNTTQGINVSTLTPGRYFLIINNNTDKQIASFIKQ